MKWSMHLFLTAAVLALLGTGVAIRRDPQPRLIRSVVVSTSTTTDPMLPAIQKSIDASNSALKACAP